MIECSTVDIIEGGLSGYIYMEPDRGVEIFEKIQQKQTKENKISRHKYRTDIKRRVDSQRATRRKHQKEEKQRKQITYMHVCTIMWPISNTGGGQWMQCHASHPPASSLPHLRAPYRCPEGISSCSNGRNLCQWPVSKAWVSPSFFPWQKKNGGHSSSGGLAAKTSFICFTLLLLHFFCARFLYCLFIPAKLFHCLWNNLLGIFR